MVRKREHDEMADRKYLYKRGGVWTVRFRLPERFGGGLFQRSLGTGDITTARRFRDLYVMPFLAGEDLFDATQSLISKAAQLGRQQDKRFDQLRAALRLEPEGSDAEPTLGELVKRYLAHVERGQLTPATMQAYSAHLDGFPKVVDGSRPAHVITKQDITRHLSSVIS